MGSRCRPILAASLVASLSVGVWASKQVKTDSFSSSLDSRVAEIEAERKAICSTSSDPKVQVACREGDLIRTYVDKGDFFKAEGIICSREARNKQPLSGECAIHQAVAEYNSLMEKGEESKAMDAACRSVIKDAYPQFGKICRERATMLAKADEFARLAEESRRTGAAFEKGGREAMLKERDNIENEKLRALEKKHSHIMRLLMLLASLFGVAGIMRLPRKD